MKYLLDGLRGRGSNCSQAYLADCSYIFEHKYLLYENYEASLSKIWLCGSFFYKERKESEVIPIQSSDEFRLLTKEKDI